MLFFSTTKEDQAFITQDWRNVFTTGPAKLDTKDYAINVWVADNFMNIEILFLSLIL